MHSEEAAPAEDVTAVGLQGEGEDVQADGAGVGGRGVGITKAACTKSSKIFLILIKYTKISNSVVPHG